MGFLDSFDTIRDRHDIATLRMMAREAGVLELRRGWHDAAIEMATRMWISHRRLTWNTRRAEVARSLQRRHSKRQRRALI